MDIEPEPQNDTLISKTHLKKVAIELQELGEKLTTFKVAELEQLPLSEKLFEAILEFKRLPNAHGARKRQLQFIGKLMREFNKQEIEQAITNLKSKSVTPSENSEVAELSNTLTQLVLESGDEGINKIVSEHDLIERQKLRQLYRDYKKAKIGAESIFRDKIRRYIHQGLSVN